MARWSDADEINLKVLLSAHMFVDRTRSMYDNAMETTVNKKLITIHQVSFVSQYDPLEMGAQNI